MGPIVAIPQDALLHLIFLARASRMPWTRRHGFDKRRRKAVRQIRQANPCLWPAVAAYEAWKQRMWQAALASSAQEAR
jgi:hypothetical protein